ncbi:MAG TPA: hypothetical protein VNF74_01380 [Terriglobales bacterium]|nr:hypothetical protein [Terriglobales bacterium]
MRSLLNHRSPAKYSSEVPPRMNSRRFARRQSGATPAPGEFGLEKLTPWLRRHGRRR